MSFDESMAKATYTEAEYKKMAQKIEAKLEGREQPEMIPATEKAR